MGSTVLYASPFPILKSLYLMDQLAHLEKWFQFEEKFISEENGSLRPLQASHLPDPIRKIF